MRTRDKTGQVIVRISPEEKAEWLKAASRAPWWGLSELVRRTVRQYIIDHPPTGGSRRLPRKRVASRRGAAR